MDNWIVEKQAARRLLNSPIPKSIPLEIALYIRQIRRKVASLTEERMRNVMPLLAFAALAAAFTSGCAGPEEKLGRGVSNLWEPARMGEMRRSVEQTVILDAPNGYSVGVIRGFDHTVARTVMGAYEIVTFPFPPYQPLFPRYVKPGPVYPESYRPGRVSEGTFDTDTYMGFSGGDVAPFLPGSRFRVFDN
jgi:putative exosortase-associated protein (TIGR04073 family)